MSLDNDELRMTRIINGVCPLSWEDIVGLLCSRVWDDTRSEFRVLSGIKSDGAGAKRYVAFNGEDYEEFDETRFYLIQKRKLK